MAIIIAASVFALTITAMFFIRGRSQDWAQLRAPRQPIPTMGVQIVCGNCSGDNLFAQKTYLDHKGNCEQCGGHSYVLAATLAVNALQQRALRAVEPAVTGGGRVIPFDPAARAARSEKVAV